MNTYTVILSRPRERIENETLIVRAPIPLKVSFRMGFQNGYAMLAREMVSRKLPDGHFRVIDRNHPTESMDRVFDWRTVYQYADLPVGEDPSILIERDSSSTLTESQREALAMLPISVEEFERQTHGKTRNILFQSGWIEMLGGMIVATKTCPDPNAPKGERTTGDMTQNMYEAVTQLLRSPSAWKDIGRRTKGYLVSLGYVEILDDVAVVTAKGRSDHASYSPPEFSVTPKQHEAFKMMPCAADDINGRIRNFMVESGWIIIRNGVAYVTANAPAPYNSKAVDPSDLPVEASVVQETLPAKSKGLTDYQRNAMALLPCSIDTWKAKVPSRPVRGMMEKSGWVIIHNNMVYATKSAPEGFGENAPVIEAPVAPVVVRAPVPRADAPKVRTVALRDEWRKVLLHVQKGMAARTWANLHGKTKNGLTAKYKAVFINNGKPALTTIGEQALETGKLPEPAATRVAA